LQDLRFTERIILAEAIINLSIVAKGDDGMAIIVKLWPPFKFPLDKEESELENPGVMSVADCCKD